MMNPEEDYVKLTHNQYKELEESQTILDYLMAHGVDNWEGYDDAMQEYRIDHCGEAN